MIKKGFDGVTNDGDMLNNNINVDYAEEVIDDDSLFNTNFVDKSLSIADNFSKSLNDIYSETIPQNGIRPNSFAFQSDVFLFVSISFDHGWRKSSSGRFADDLRKYFVSSTFVVESFKQLFYIFVSPFSLITINQHMTQSHYQLPLRQLKIFFRHNFFIASNAKRLDA